MTGLSLGTVNKAFSRCVKDGLAGREGITESGVTALEPYRVENAVIMAAGLSSRFVPLSYEKPKGMMRIRGEILIERQIRQLHEAGITDITLVVGYMKEAFFYLEDLFGVKIVVNEHFAERNNNSTLHLVRNILGNTYICSSDDYFTQNPFTRYVYRAYYSTVFFAGPTDEYVVETGPHGRITKVGVNGGNDAWCMLGHVYFDRAFSKKFVEILEAEYDLPETAPKLWEDIFAEHVHELSMARKEYESGIIFEFDSLEDVRAFDKDFLANVDSSILDNICNFFSCDREDLSNVVPIKEGITNLSFRFSLREKTYVYRHPGSGTEAIICRDSEAFSQKVAKDLGVDSTFLYEDSEHGWKLSYFIKDCVPFDYHDPAHVSAALGIARKLHTCDVKSEWSFDVYAKAREIVESLEDRSYPKPVDFDSLTQSIDRVHDLVASDADRLCLCHNDMYAPNFLVHASGMDLIDWEYSAMADYASDLGTFICCSDYTPKEAEGVVREYFGRTPTPEEMRHCFGYVAICSYYWYVWALYKQSEGGQVGSWVYLWYRSAKRYAELCLSD